MKKACQVLRNSGWVLALEGYRGATRWVRDQHSGLIEVNPSGWFHMPGALTEAVGSDWRSLRTYLAASGY